MSPIHSQIRKPHAALLLGTVIMLGLAGCGGGATSGSGGDKTISIGAAEPLSGAFATSGKDELAGANLAISEINAAGGIKSLGGAKLQLATADAGDTAQQATTAARQVLNKQPVAAIGCWYSSLTLAATQISEQMRIPWVTGSGSDQLVGRGFHYTYQISDGVNESASVLIQTLQSFKSTGSGGTRLAILQDNNVASVDLTKTIQTQLAASGNGTIVSDQTWTPPLADATPPVTAILQAKPTAILIEATSTTDEALVLKQLKAQGNTTPVVMGASSAVNPSFLDSVGAAGMEGVFVPSSIAFPGKGSEALVKKYTDTTKEPYMGAEAFNGYSEVQVVAQALELSKTADPQAVKKALDTMAAKNVPAIQLLPGGDTLQFGPEGRRKGVAVELLQWQNGLPRVTSPAAVANATAEKAGR